MHAHGDWNMCYTRGSWVRIYGESDIERGEGSRTDTQIRYDGSVPFPGFAQFLWQQTTEEASFQGTA